MVDCKGSATEQKGVQDFKISHKFQDLAEISQDLTEILQDLTQISLKISQDLLILQK